MSHPVRVRAPSLHTGSQATAPSSPSSTGGYTPPIFDGGRVTPQAAPARVRSASMSALPQVSARDIPPARPIAGPIRLDHSEMRHDRNRAFRVAYLFFLIIPWILIRVGESIGYALKFRKTATPSEAKLFNSFKQMNVNLHDASLSQKSTGIELKRLVHHVLKYQKQHRENGNRSFRVNHSNFLCWNGTQAYTITMHNGKTYVSLNNRIAHHANPNVKLKRAIEIDEFGNMRLVYETRTKESTTYTTATQAVTLADSTENRPFDAFVIRSVTTEAELQDLFSYETENGHRRPGDTLDRLHERPEYHDQAFVGVEFDYGVQSPVTKLIRVGQTLVHGYLNRNACHVFNITGYRKIEGQLYLVFADSLGALATKQEYLFPLSDLNKGHEFVVYKPRRNLPYNKPDGSPISSTEYSQTVAKLLYQNVNADQGSETYTPYAHNGNTGRADDQRSWGYAYGSCGVSPIRRNFMGSQGEARLAQSMYYFLRGERMKHYGTDKVDTEFCSPFSMRASQTALFYLLMTDEEKLRLKGAAESKIYLGPRIYQATFKEVFGRILTDHPQLETDPFFYKDPTHITPASFHAAINPRTYEVRQVEDDVVAIGQLRELESAERQEADAVQERRAAVRLSPVPVHLAR